MPQAEVVANYARVQALAAELALDDAAYRRALEIAGLTPGRREWLHYIDRVLAAIGSLLVVAGFAAFFAWNWADLGPAAKFALIQAGVVAAVGIAWRLGIDSIPGRSSLFAAAFLVGVLLAIYGQVYQTGADPYGLFLGWAVTILPWAIVGRQAGLWLLFQLLLNLTVIMYWTQVLHPPEGWWQLSQLLGPLVWLGSTIMDSRLASYLFAMNAVCLVIWEYLTANGVRWVQGRWFPRIIAFLALNTVVIPAMLTVFSAALGGRLALSYLSPVLFVAALAMSLYYYQYRKPDLFILTIAMFGAIMVIMSLAVRVIFKDITSTLLLAGLLIGMVAGATYWLRDISRRWEGRS